MDLNGDIQHFVQLTTAVERGELWDVGAVEHWDLDGEGVRLPTCKAHGSRRDTRRDYMFCNAAALTRIKAFRRGEFGVLDAHAPLACMFENVRRGPDITKQRKPKAWRR